MSWYCTPRPTTRRAGGAKSPALHTSAPARGLDGGDVDLLHRHHRLECSPGFRATHRQRLGQHAWGDLPGDTPAVLAPAACAFLAAIADDRVPVTVGLVLRVRRHL